jgi:hypothetical protein
MFDAIEGSEVWIPLKSCVGIGRSWDARVRERMKRRAVHVARRISCPIWKNYSASEARFAILRLRCVRAS